MKKSTMHRLLSLTMATTLICGTMAGCGSSNSSGEAAEDENTVSTASAETTADSEEALDTSEHMDITIGYWGVEQSLSGGDNDAVLKKVEDDLNITLKPVNVTWDDYVQKTQLWAASDTLPDIMATDVRFTSNFYKWAEQGLLKEIPQDLSAYPYLEAYMDSSELTSCQVDGKTYAIFRKTYDSQPWTTIDRMTCYRWDLAQKAGFTEKPQSFDDFCEQMKAIIAQDPDGTGVQGMSASNYSIGVGWMLQYSTFLSSSEGQSFKWVNDNGTLKPAYFTEDVLSSLKYWRKAYEDGVVEKDIALETNTQADEKALQGQSAAFCRAGGFNSSYATIGNHWAEVHNGDNYLDDVICLSTLEGKDGAIYYPVKDYAWSETIISHNVDDAKLQRILMLYDYLLQDDNAFLTTYGFEGEDFNFDENGKVVLTEENDELLNKYPSIDLLSNLVRWTPATYDERFIFSAPEEYNEVNVQAMEKVKDIPLPENYVPEATGIFLSLGSDFSLTVSDDFLSIMTGTEDVETMWNDVKAKYESAGLQDVIDEVNAKAKEQGLID